MKPVPGILLAATAFLVIVSLPSCVTFKQPPDPAKVQAKIAEYREQELALVHSTVADPERADRLIALLAERDRLTGEYAMRIAEHREKLAALAADYDSRREDFEAQLADFNRRRATAQQESIELVAAMKAATTSEEWEIISEFQLKRLDLRQLSYGNAGRGG